MLRNFKAAKLLASIAFLDFGGGDASCATEEFEVKINNSVMAISRFFGMMCLWSYHCREQRPVERRTINPLIL